MVEGKMITFVKKWKIDISTSDSEPNKITFYVNENHYSNLLQMLSNFDFGMYVYRIDIIEIKHDVQQQTGAYTNIPVPLQTSRPLK